MSGKAVSVSNNYFCPIKRAHLKLSVLITFFATTLFITEIHFSPKVFAQETNKVNRQSDIERKILSEIRIAKNFIGNRNWDKAQIRLADIIQDFPQSHHLDIAYYWLAYTLFQQKKLSEAENTIAGLQRKFPNSKWFDESKSLTVEINSKNGKQSNLTDEEFSKSDDETKAFAIQNLLETDRSQGMLKIGEILASPDKTTESLKESVLILLFNDKSDWATDKFIEVIKNEKAENLLKQALIGLKKRDEKKTLPVLRDFLLQNTNENLLDAALYSVSGLTNETALNTLDYFARNGGTDELKQKSIIWLGNIGSKSAIENLRVLYGFFREIELKQQVQVSLSEINSPESLQILINLIEAETNKDLIEHGLEMLKQKKSSIVLKYLKKKLRVKI